jgi:hypothetical protein
MLRISPVEGQSVPLYIKEVVFILKLYSVYILGENWGGDNGRIPSNFSFFFVFLDKSKTWMGLALFMEDINVRILFFFCLCVVYFTNKAFI